VLLLVQLTPPLSLSDSLIVLARVTATAALLVLLSSCPLSFFFISSLSSPSLYHLPPPDGARPERLVRHSRVPSADQKRKSERLPPTLANNQQRTMSRQSPPAPDDDDDHVLVDAHLPNPPSSAPPPPRSPPPPPPPDPLRRPPPSHQHPSLTQGASQSSSFQPQTTHNARQQLGPGPDQRQHQQHQLQQPIQPQLQPTPSSPVQSYPQQNRQITLEPQRPSTSSPKHQSAKGGVRGRITVVCAEVLLFLPSSLPHAHHPDL
jgi:hypothetical protein